MTVEAPENVTRESLDLVKSTISELRLECAGFEEFVIHTLSQLDEMRLDLLKREEFLEIERERLASEQTFIQRERSEFDIEQQSGSVADGNTQAVEQDLDRTRAELDSERTRADSGELHQAVLQQRNVEIQRERDRLIVERDAVARELDAKIELDKQLQASQREMELSRREVGRLKDEVEEMRTRSSSAASPKFTELQEEREILEAELEQARRRASELANEIAEQKQQLEDERSGWSDELKELRSLLETRAVNIAGVNNTQAAPPVNVPPQASVGTEPATAGNPVAGSVLAQFEQLKRQAATRRTG